MSLKVLCYSRKNFQKFCIVCWALKFPSDISSFYTTEHMKNYRSIMFYFPETYRLIWLLVLNDCKCRMGIFFLCYCISSWWFHNVHLLVFVNFPCIGLLFIILSSTVRLINLLILFFFHIIEVCCSLLLRLQCKRVKEVPVGDPKVGGNPYQKKSLKNLSQLVKQ